MFGCVFFERFKQRQANGCCGTSPFSENKKKHRAGKLLLSRISIYMRMCTYILYLSLCSNGSFSSSLYFIGYTTTTTTSTTPPHTHASQYNMWKEKQLNYTNLAAVQFLCPLRADDVKISVPDVVYITCIAVGARFCVFLAPPYTFVFREYFRCVGVICPP